MHLREVSVAFGRRGLGRERASAVLALDDVTLAVGRAEIVSLVGESGAGKSTLARVLVGLERPRSGQVWFDNEDITAQSERQWRQTRQRLHLVFQDPYASLHPGMRIGTAIGEPLAIAGLDAAERAPRVREALEEVELSPAADFLDRYPQSLSGGQRQRVALARALVGRPQFIIADEPTSMLDVSMRAGILNLLLRIRDRHGIALLLITHDLAVARHVSDRIVVLYRGRVVEEGATDDVVARPLHPYTRALLDAAEHFTAARSSPQVATSGGCSYRGQCAHAIDRCRTEVPQLRGTGPGRNVACHRAEDTMK